MNQILDPAWYYSTLAQTSAAIVGLIGAILINRVMDHIVQMRNEDKDLIQVIHCTWKTLNDFTKELLSLKGYFAREIEEDRTAIKNGLEFRFVNSVRSFGMGGIGQKIENLPQHLIQMENDLRAADILTSVYTTLSGIGVRYRLRSQVFFNAKLESNGLPCLSTP